MFTFKSLLSVKAQGKESNPASKTPNPNLSYLEREAIVDQTIQPGRSGRVRFQASWWPARCEQEITLLPGEIVYVVGIHNITLLVEPASLNGSKS